MELYSRNDTNHVVDITQSKPLKIAIVTSLRDVIGEDKNGKIVDTSWGQAYMMGVVEALARGVEENVAGIRNALQIVGVIYDDTEIDIANIAREMHSPVSGYWMHPLNLQDTHTGELLINKTHNLSSLWRLLEPGTARVRAKEEWEKLLGHIAFTEMKADVLLSDHLMVLLETLVQKDLGYAGRLLNIHPAITSLDDPDHLRGCTPTLDAIRKAKNEGHFYTGSTLHYLTEELDGGEKIAVAKKRKFFPMILSKISVQKIIYVRLQ